MKQRFGHLVLSFMLFLAAALACAGFRVDASEEILPSNPLAGPVVTTNSSTSHLPIIVVTPSRYDADGFILEARLALYDMPGGVMHPAAAPAVAVRVSMRAERGSRLDEKVSYAVTLVDDGALSLAGLPACREWKLQGSVRDKAMLRNGMAYGLGRVLFPDVTPATRYCEVFVDAGGRLDYRGIYILAESLRRIGRDIAREQGETVFLRRTEGGEFRSDELIRVGSTAFTITSVDADGNIATTLPATRRDGIETDLQNLERFIYSVKPTTFLQYHTLLDEKSAIDLFILNTIMVNTIEYMAPCTVFQNRDGKFQFLPEWHFGYAFDNRPRRVAPLPFRADMAPIEPPSVLARKVPVWRILERGGDIRDLRMYPVYTAMNGQHYLWFDHLFLSSSFIDGLYARYHELTRTHLTPGFIGSYADSLFLQLGDAVHRDWDRWRDLYTAVDGRHAVMPFVTEDGDVRIRQTFSPAEELVKINHLLAEQHKFVLEQLETLDWMTADLYDRSTSGTRQAAYSLITLVGMFFLTHLLTRRL